MEKKITKRMQYMDIIEMANSMNRPDIVEFCEHEIELLDKKSVRNASTLTKTQKENLEIVEVIYNTLKELNKPSYIADLMAANADLANLSTQKISALLKKLVDTNRVVKVTEKNKAIFSIAD